MFMVGKMRVRLAEGVDFGFEKILAANLEGRFVERQEAVGHVREVLRGRGQETQAVDGSHFVAKGTRLDGGVAEVWYVARV